MTARILEGKALAESVRADVAQRVAALTASMGRAPVLVAVLVGDAGANVTYARAKGRAAGKVGVDYRLVQLPADTDTAAVTSAIRDLNADPVVDGILVELPLPPGCDAHRVQGAIDPARDVDGVSPESQSRALAGLPGPRPATARAVMALLESGNVDLVGCRATVFGRSLSVGRPVALLLLEAHATVTIAHSRTRDLAAVGREADVLVVAVGVPGLVRSEHVKRGAVVIDVGTTVVETEAGSRLTGDVDFDSVAEAAAVLTPVPGGVGPVTTAIALRTAVELAEERHRGRTG